MATVYIHIGMEKTGSTAIQSFLTANADALEKQNAVYPDFGLKYDWASGDINGYWLMDGEEAFPQSCIAKINRLAGIYDTILVSAECLWNKQGYRPEFWKSLKDRLEPGICVKMLAYVRRQDAYVYSHWAMQVKVQNPASIEKESFQSCIADGGYRDNRLDYKEYLEGILPVLGIENVIIRPYEAAQFEGGSLYADFLSAAGLRMNESFLLPKGRQNDSLRGNVLETKRLWNALPEFTGKQFLIKPYLEAVQCTMEEKGTLRERVIFPKEEREAFLRPFAESNEWTARRMLGREDGVLFCEQIPEDAGEADPVYTSAEIAAVGMEMIEKLMQENRAIKRTKQNAEGFDIPAPVDRQDIYDEMLRNPDTFTEQEHRNMIDDALALLYDDDGMLQAADTFYEDFYNTLQDMIRREFSNVQLRPDGEKLYARCSAVAKYTFSEFKALRSKKLVVSLTSYPARIAFAAEAVSSILQQTKQADEVVLWLADTQFPEKEKDLPQKLRTFAKEGSLRIRWVDDLKSHKKYFYAFSEYPDVLLVTIDDDIYYPPDTLERLFESFLLWPGAVSAGRVRCMAADEDGALLPYRLWPNNPDTFTLEPSNAFLAIGVGGVLYPTGLFAASPLLDAEAVRETCLYADDIWLKAMEVVAGIPVVPAHRRRELQYIDGSQDTALSRLNLNKDINDIYFGQVQEWLCSHTDGFVGWQTGRTQELLLCEESIISAQNRIRVKEYQALEKQYSLLAREHEKLTERSDKQSRRLEELKSRNENLRVKLENTRSSRKELVQMNAQLKHENEELCRELENLRAELRHPIKSAAKKTVKKAGSGTDESK